MKKLKILPAIFMMIVCVGVLVSGVYASQLVDNPIFGTIAVEATVSQSVEIKMSIKGSKNGDVVTEPKTVRATTSFNLGNLEFMSDAFGGGIKDIVITFSIKNLGTYSNNQELADNAIGVFFGAGNSSLSSSAMASDVLVEDSIKSGEDVVVNAMLTSYTAILPGETRELSISLSMENLIDIDKTNIAYKLYIEDYVAETTSDGLVKLPIVQTSGASEISTLSATPLADDELFTTITSTTIANKSNVVYVAMPSTITNMEDGTSSTVGAFAGASNLKAISMSENLQTIGAYAFYNCSALKQIDIVNISQINTNGFYSCSGIKKVFAQSIEQWLNFDFNSNTTPLCGGADLYINERKLTHLIVSNYSQIKANAFYGCTSLENVDLVNVQTIQASAFKGCSGLKSISIPNVQTIENQAFDGCNNLSRVDIVNLSNWLNRSFVYETANPLYYGADLYLNGTKLTNLVIPSGITELKRYVFKGCTSITSVDLSDIEIIEYNAFDGCTNLQSINLSNVKTIGESAFSNCENLTNIQLSDVGVIGKDAFMGCSGLVRVDISSLVDWLTINFEQPTSNPLSYGASLYVNSTKLTELVVPSNITTIQKYAFYCYISLVSVDLVNVQTIEDDAFYGCTALNNINVGSNLQSINPGIFDSTNIESFNIDPQDTNLRYLGNNTNPYLILYKTIDSNIQTATINENTKFIYDRAFYQCIYLTSIDLVNVENVGDEAFSGCSSLYDIDLGNIQTIGKNSFDGISENAFNINPLDESLRYIGSDENPYLVLYKRISNSAVTASISPQTKFIYDGAFSDNTNLTNLDLQNVETVGHFAFSGCTNLVNIASENVKAIGVYAFNNCVKLKYVDLDNLFTVRGYTFNGCTALENIDLAGVRTIGGSAFRGCTSLTNVNLASVRIIGPSVFYGCTSLQTITIPTSVTTIWATSANSSPFYNCSTDLQIICAASSKPDGWDNYWNYYSFDGQLEVSWGG